MYLAVAGVQVSGAHRMSRQSQCQSRRARFPSDVGSPGNGGGMLWRRRSLSSMLAAVWQPVSHRGQWNAAVNTAPAKEQRPRLPIPLAATDWCPPPLFRLSLPFSLIFSSHDETVCLSKPKLERRGENKGTCTLEQKIEPRQDCIKSTKREREKRQNKNKTKRTLVSIFFLCHCWLSPLVLCLCLLWLLVCIGRCSSLSCTAVCVKRPRVAHWQWLGEEKSRRW